MSSFGKYFKITTFGESHCPSVGVVIDAPPSNFKLDLDRVQKQLSRRRPGQSDITTPRNELDQIIVLSGMENGLTLGTPLTIIVNNKNIKPEDYNFSEENEFDFKNYIPRPSHSDLTYLWKYGIHAKSGGGRSSARETIGRVIAGAIANQILEQHKISVTAFVSQVGDIIPSEFETTERELSRDIIDKYKTRCPSEESNLIERKILELKENGNSIGGKVKCIIKNCPRGLGEPVFDKMEAMLAHAMLSIPATKGFEIGSGFDCVNQTGSIHNDVWLKDGKTKTNNNGGIIGGITNGEDIIFSVAFKPPATILMDQETINLKGDSVTLKAKGRHDPCVVPRAVPIVEAMASLCLVDLLYSQISKRNVLSNNIQVNHHVV